MALWGQSGARCLERAVPSLGRAGGQRRTGSRSKVAALSVSTKPGDEALLHFQKPPDHKAQGDLERKGSTCRGGPGTSGAWAGLLSGCSASSERQYCGFLTCSIWVRWEAFQEQHRGRGLNALEGAKSTSP